MLLLFLPGLALAGFRPFSGDSLAGIGAARQGMPFLLLLWSVDCPPCLQELKTIGPLASRFPPGGLVLISTDNAERAGDAWRILQRHGLTRAENWRFTGDFPERLRYRIDPEWYGELPRAYFYNARHERVGHSGTLSRALLQQFITQSYSIE